MSHVCVRSGRAISCLCGAKQSGRDIFSRIHYTDHSTSTHVTFERPAVFWACWDDLQRPLGQKRKSAQWRTSWDLPSNVILNIKVLHQSVVGKIVNLVLLSTKLQRENVCNFEYLKMCLTQLCNYFIIDKIRSDVYNMKIKLNVCNRLMWFTKLSSLRTIHKRLISRRDFITFTKRAFNY